MKIKSRLDRKVHLAFGSAKLTLLAMGAMSDRGIRVSRGAGRRRLNV